MRYVWIWAFLVMLVIVNYYQTDMINDFSDFVCLNHPDLVIQRWQEEFDRCG